MNRYDESEESGEFSPGKARRMPLGRRRAGQGTAVRATRRGRWRWMAQLRSSRRLGPLLGPHPVLGMVAVVTTVLTVGVSVTAYALVRNIYDGVHQEVINITGPRPPKLNGSTNILLIGSDSRAGTHGYGQGVQGSRSDTSMLLHISPDHKHAYVISFPRDAVVPVYGCEPDHYGHHPGQTAEPGAVERLNATFSNGGVACLWTTLEHQTNIHLDYFVEVDFNSFKSIVNDLGGVTVCLPFAIHNQKANLNLPAGRHVVNGAQALGFVRLRENIGMGSDLQRIQRQQLFLVSAMKKARKANLLSNYHVLADAAHAVTTDMSLTQMLGVAYSMKGLSTANLRFIQVPVVDYPADPNEVEWEQPYAQQLFAAISRDTQIMQKAKAAKKADKGKTGKTGKTAAPSQVQLEVLNGSGASGVASTTATDLANRGFNVVGTGNADNFSYTQPVIEYSSASQLPEVNALKKQVPGVQVKQVTGGLTPGTIGLVLGSKFSSLTPPKGPSVNRISRSQNVEGINGNQNICRDSSAFAGPDSPVPSG